MAKPYSRDLRERVVAAVEGLSRRKATAQFGIGTGINWLRRLRDTGSVLPVGGHKPKAIVNAHRGFLLIRIKEKDFTLRGLVTELGPSAASRSMTGRYGTSSMPRNSASKKPCAPANRIARTSRASRGRKTRPESCLVLGDCLICDGRSADGIVVWADWPRQGPRLRAPARAACGLDSSLPPGLWGPHQSDAAA